MVKIKIIEKSDKDLLINEEYRTQILGPEVSELYGEYLKLVAQTIITTTPLQILRQVMQDPDIIVYTGARGTSVRLDIWINTIDKESGAPRAFPVNSEIPVVSISLHGFTAQAANEKQLQALFRVHVFLLFLRQQPLPLRAPLQNKPPIVKTRSEKPQIASETSTLGNFVYHTELGKDLYLLLNGIFIGDSAFLRKATIKKELQYNRYLFDLQFARENKRDKQLTSLYASYPSLAVAKRAVKEKLAFLEALMTNNCPHIALLAEYRNAVLKRDRKAAFSKLKEFFANKKEVEQQITCKACKMRIMCKHVQIAEEFAEDFKLLEQHMIPFQDTQTYDMEFYCKYCGEKLYASQYYQDLDAVTGIGEYVVTTVDRIIYRSIMRIFDMVKISPEMNRRNLINAMMEMMRPFIDRSRASLEKSKRTEEEIDNYLSAQAMVFSATYLIYLAERLKKGIMFPDGATKTVQRIQKLGAEIVKQFRTEYINQGIIKSFFTTSYAFIHKLKYTPTDIVETHGDLVNFIRNDARLPFFINSQVLCEAPLVANRTDDLAIKREQITTKKILALLRMQNVKDPIIYDMARVKKPNWSCLKDSMRAKIRRIVWKRVFPSMDLDKLDNVQFPPDEELNALTKELRISYLVDWYLPFSMPQMGVPREPLQQMDIRWFYDSSGAPFEKPWLGNWNILKKGSAEKIATAHRNWLKIQEFKAFYREVCPIAIRHSFVAVSGRKGELKCKYCGLRNHMTESDWRAFVAKYRDKLKTSQRITNFIRGKPIKYEPEKKATFPPSALKEFPENVRDAPANALELLGQLTGMESFPDPKILPPVETRWDFRIPLVDANIKIVYQYYNLLRFVGSENSDIKQILDDTKFPAGKIIALQKLPGLSLEYNREKENRFYTMAPGEFYRWQKDSLAALIAEIGKKEKDIAIRKTLMVLVTRIKEIIWSNTLSQMVPEMLKVGVDYVFRTDLEPIDDEELEEGEDEDFDFEPDTIDEDDSFEMDDHSDR